MGGSIQPPGHVQTLVRLLTYGMNPQAALDAPRWKLNGGVSVDLEPTASPELREGLIALGHEIKAVADSYMDYGAGQMIVAHRRRLRGRIGSQARRSGRRLLTRGAADQAPGSSQQRSAVGDADSTAPVTALGR